MSAIVTVAVVLCSTVGVLFLLIIISLFGPLTMLLPSLPDEWTTLRLIVAILGFEKQNRKSIMAYFYCHQYLFIYII